MRTTLLLVLLIVFGTAINAYAAEFDYEVRAGWGLSDNISRTAANEGDEEFAIIDLLVSGEHQTRRVDFAVDADVGFRHYSSNSFDDEVIGAFNVLLDYGIIPDVLTWRTSDKYGTLQSDPFQALTPDNRENVNNFSTGPDLHIQFGGALALDVGAYFRVNNFEVSNIDNDVIGGNLALVRALSSNRQYSLNLSADRIEYDDDTLGGFDRQIAYVSFSSQISRGSVKVDLGVNELHDGGVTQDGFYGDFSIQRELSSRSTLTLSYNQQLSDAGDIFRQFQDPGRSLGEPPDISATASPFENKRFQLGFDHERKTSTWFLTAKLNEEDYIQDASLNRRLYGITVGAMKMLGDRWRAQLEGNLLRGELYTVGRDDDDIGLSFGLSNQISRSVDIRISLGLYERQSSDPLFDYRENRIEITIR